MADHVVLGSLGLEQLDLTQTVAALAVVVGQGQRDLRRAVAPAHGDEDVIGPGPCGGSVKADDELAFVLGDWGFARWTDLQVAEIKLLIDRRLSKTPMPGRLRS